MINDSDRNRAVELIDEARANGARLIPCCEIIGINARTYQRWNQTAEIKIDQRSITKRPTPKNKLSEEERQSILTTVNNSEYADLPPSQIVPKLADEGKYIASESTIYRVLKEEKMNTHRSKVKPSKKRIPPTHIATAPNQVWTWDITWLNAPVKGQYYKLYMVVDMYSRFIVAHEVWETENATYAQELITRATRTQKTYGKPLVLHSDNGSPMKAATFLATLEKLGVQYSFSRPRVSNDNPYSEALFRTLKYRPVYPNSGFASISEARKWVADFVSWYNNIHLHSGINFITPYQRHNGLDNEVMQNRIKVYTEAKNKNPERWSKNIRNWSLPSYVALNPIKENEFQTTANDVG